MPPLLGYAGFIGGRRGLPRVSTFFSLQRSTASSTACQSIRWAHTVYATDPRFVIDKYSLREYDDSVRGSTNARAFLKMELSDRLYEKLQNNEMQYMPAEGDDPGNFYVLGKHGELFEYDYLGSHAAYSGLTSIVEEETAEDAIVNAATVSPHKEEWDQEEMNTIKEEWDVFRDKITSVMKEKKTKSIVMKGEFPNFMFVGEVLHAPAMAVYTLGQSERQTGIMLHSEDAAEED